jgi:single-strand DNA-binding protein
MSYNKVILIGRLGKDPEVKTVGSEGNKVAEVSLATSETYKDKSGEKQSKTEWHKCIFWGNIAGVIEQHLKKGSQIAVEGKIEYRTYEDKDGNKRYVTEIKCTGMTMLDTKADSAAAQSSAPSTPASDTGATAAQFTAGPVEDDLLF